MKPTIREIQNAFCTAWGIRPMQLTGRSRCRKYKVPRDLAIVTCLNAGYRQQVVATAFNRSVSHVQTIVKEHCDDKFSKEAQALNNKVQLSLTVNRDYETKARAKMFVRARIL